MSTTRRTFLQASAAIATAQFPILGANDKVQVGIVGLGGRGNDHMGFYEKIPDVRIAAVCDVNQAARERARALQLPYRVYFPTPGLSTDNAAMIAAAAFPKLARGEFASLDVSAQANLRLAS